LVGKALASYLINEPFLAPTSKEKTSWAKRDYTSFDTALKQTCEWFKTVYSNVRGY
jgi:hypothetical protein